MNQIGTFIQIVVITIFLFFGYQFLNGKLVIAPKIIPDKPRRTRVKQINKLDRDNIPNPEQKGDIPVSKPAINTRANTYLALMIGLIVFEMLCIWSLDISVSALNVNRALGGDYAVVEGLFIQNPTVQYHLSLYGIIIGTVLMAFMGLKLMRVSGKLPTITPTYVPLKDKLAKPQPRGVVLNFVSHGLSLSFVVWLMLLATIAGLSPNHQFIMDWNHFNEFWFEFALMVIVSVIVFVGFWEHLKQFKKAVKR